MTKPETPELSRPENKGITDHASGNVKPWELDAELAQSKMAELMINRLGTPSILDKNFAVRYGIFTALNHSISNLTGYDSSLRIAVYREYAAQSVNEDGYYFRSFWAYMMKPKYVINGNMQPGQEEQKESLIGRMVGWFRGGEKDK